MDIAIWIVVVFIAVALIAVVIDHIQERRSPAWEYLSDAAIDAYFDDLDHDCQ